MIAKARWIYHKGRCSMNNNQKKKMNIDSDEKSWAQAYTTRVSESIEGMITSALRMDYMPMLGKRTVSRRMSLLATSCCTRTHSALWPLPLCHTLGTHYLLAHHSPSFSTCSLTSSSMSGDGLALRFLPPLCVMCEVGTNAKKSKFCPAHKASSWHAYSFPHSNFCTWK